ncbi:MAG: histidine kinase [Bacteroidetes bacterium]|nr:histidine kinase [Bacteroidota bacterium]
MLNLIGWLLFHLLCLLLYFDPKSGLIEYGLYITYAISGFITTLFLRYVYKKLLFKNDKKSVVRLLLVIFSTSILSLILYKGLEILTSIAFTPINYWILNIIKPTVFSFIRDNLLGFLTLIIWSILYYMINMWIEFIVNEERIVKAEIHSKKSQLQMLRYQLNPHFLFNSLNSIKALTIENPQKAGFMITELSEFLRATLNYNDRIFITIREEIDIIEKYLSIEKIRFEERLEHRITFSEGLLDKEIPCFITQPLVENAIIHGLTSNPGGINLWINFSINDEFLIIEVENSGVLNKNKITSGTGIKNIIERLENSYPGQFKLDITQINNFVNVQLIIPSKQ